jgi:hypothetical protein
LIARHRLRLKSLSITGQVECATSPDETAEQTIEDKISAAAMEHRSRLDFDGKTFSGPAWDRVVAEGAAAQFFLVGEEQGIAENPKLVAQLFSELSNRGYSKLANHGVEFQRSARTSFGTGAQKSSTARLRK